MRAMTRDDADSRKVRLTKRVLREALVELLQDRDIARVTVTSVCALADVHRSTFYAHYETIFDLLDDVEKDYLEHVPYLVLGESRAVAREEFRGYLRYVADNRAVFRALLANGRMQDRVIDASLARMAEISPMEPAEYEATVRYATAGTFSLIDWWVRLGCQDADSMADTLLDITERMSGEY